MLIKTLVENTSTSVAYKQEHGLSLYIETASHKLLFDTGASGIFTGNAKKMSVDLQAVDIAVLSHGHYDHGGGLKAFINLNTGAKIYVHRRAFHKHYAKKPGGEIVYIGLDEKLLPDRRFVFVEEKMTIDEELTLFSAVRGCKLAPSGNEDLLVEEGGLLKRDKFAHEQNLLIRDKGSTLLLAGCAHRGIINIIEHLIHAGYNLPDYIVAGFHLFNRVSRQCEKPARIRKIGEYLKETGASYYTCHCTGAEPYKVLKEIMGDQIGYMATGSQLII